MSRHRHGCGRQDGRGPHLLGHIVQPAALGPRDGRTLLLATDDRAAVGATGTTVDEQLRDLDRQFPDFRFRAGEEQHRRPPPPSGGRDHGGLLSP